ncbi:hypothetical protein ABTX35_06690 [Streptomyces sp. NPDC096080]|uniref:hypothetical protein n=1 Tax=Streptomyces sp. NPDC096080 TaxID=3156693 RepID=UPI00332BB382
MSVKWQITRSEGTSYRLHNVGNETAEAVTILENGLDGLGRDLPEGVALPPGESVRFVMLEVDQLPSRTEVLVKWSDGGPEPVRMP